MHAIHIQTTLNSDILKLPEMQPLIGKKVEITVREAVPIAAMPHGERPLTGSILRDEDPFGPAMPPEAWEANQ